jgi:hypothetical protein
MTINSWCKKCHGLITAPYPYGKRWSWTPQCITMARHTLPVNALRAAVFHPFWHPTPYAYALTWLADWLEAFVQRLDPIFSLRRHGVVASSPWKRMTNTKTQKPEKRSRGFASYVPEDGFQDQTDVTPTTFNFTFETDNPHDQSKRAVHDVTNCNCINSNIIKD